ncbi:MAG: ABC transporter permease [candidate division Zixibacteria bacterium]|nr:ABC transporter permease [candidate division Zixibacteria bacterium]
MKGFLFLKLFLRDFKKQRKKITLTTLAIAWGTFSIVMLLAFGEGLNKQLTKANHGLGEGIVIIWGGQTTMPYQGLGKGRRINFTEEDVELLKARIPEIKNVGGEYTRWEVPMSYGKNSVTEMITGLYPCYEEMRSHYPDKGGRFINELDLQYKKRVVFLGNGLKERLLGKEEAVGKTIIINNIPFTVIGVMQDKLQMGAYGEPDKDKASIPATTFKTIWGYKYFNNLVYQIKDLERAEEVKKEVYKVLGVKHKFNPEDERALSIWDVIENEKVFNKVMLGISIFMGIIGGMTLLIAGIGVANIMYATVKQRTREIGIKMALGAKKKDIMSQFILESLIIAFLGGGVGIVLTSIVVKILQAIPIESEGLQFLGKPTISWGIMIITIIILGMVGLFSGFFPSRKAASVNPVESLRYE